MADALVRCPPTVLRKTCCKVVLSPPKPGDWYEVNLNFLMGACPKCHELCRYEAVLPEGTGA